MDAAVEPTPISTRYLRARTRKLEAVVAAMAEAGVEARTAGADFELVGLERLAAPDRALLERLQPDIERHLAEPGADDPEALLELLDVEVELVDHPEQARRVIAELPGAIGLDIETMPREPGPPPALRLTRSGRRYVDQPAADTTGAALCPFRGKPRLIQAHDPEREIVFIFDMAALDYADLAGLVDRQCFAHSMFEPLMLGAQGVELPRLVDTLQLASLVLGAGDKVRTLRNVAQQVLGLELRKELGASYWAARNLSDQQLAYAAGDSVVAYRAGKAMWRRLEARERQAFMLANQAVPVIARMRLRGLPFDPEIHARTIAGWQADYAHARQEFRELTGAEVPAGGPATRDWLAGRLPAEALEAWERTPTGLLATGADDLKRRALDWPEVRPLIALRKAEKRLETFGQRLLDQIVPATGRLHGDYFLPTATGRLSCRRPNLQHLPPDVQRAVEAPPGHVFLKADYNQIEMRIGAEQAREESMRAAFAAGEDQHAKTATTTLIMIGGPAFASLPATERDLERKKAKSTNFGGWYGIGARSLRKKIWADHEIEVSVEDAQAILNAFHQTFPAVRPYQREQYALGRFDAVWSAAGRPRRACWEPEVRDRRTGEVRKPAGELWFTDCCNHRIQASAADTLLEAMVRVDRALPETLVASVHDELLLLVPGDRAEKVAEILAEEMTAAFARWFTEAPQTGLLAVEIVRCWADAK